MEALKNLGVEAVVRALKAFPQSYLVEYVGVSHIFVGRGRCSWHKVSLSRWTERKGLKRRPQGKKSKTLTS